MFGAEIQAWDNGPVVVELWQAEDKGLPIPPARPLDHEVTLVVDFVVSRYGRLSGRDLIELTHVEEPWQEANRSGGINSVITPDASARTSRQMTSC
jgi:uncharacterized phage-associated protein